jgi:hypothetical protein
MNIQPYIAQLLYRYQCVTVPGFGAFLTEIQSAQWIESANSFFPPKKMVSFNANLKNNDGLLANHIAQIEKTSYDHAVSAIQQEVAIWKKTLDESGFFSLKNIGDIRLNEEKNLVFKPYNQTNYLSSSFGLSSFVSPVVNRELLDYALNTNERAVVTLYEEEKTSTSYLKYAAIAIVGLGLLASISYPLYENRIASQTKLVENSVQQKVNTKIQEATFFINNPLPAMTLTVKEGKLPYHLVAGAFRNEKNAEKIFKRLSNKGYKSRLLPVNKYGLYPVVYGSYATLAEAEKVKRSIHENENPEAWVLINEEL